MPRDKAARIDCRNRQAQRSAGAFRLEGNKANRCKDEGLNRRVDEDNQGKGNRAAEPRPLYRT